MTCNSSIFLSSILQLYFAEFVLRSLWSDLFNDLDPGVAKTKTTASTDTMKVSMCCLHKDQCVLFTYDRMYGGGWSAGPNKY